MTKKISLTLCQDGTANNKVIDSETGNQTNVARIHDSLVADYSFNISKLDPTKPEENGTSSLEKITIKRLEGNSLAFGDFVDNIDEISQEDQPLQIKLYHNGVGSRGDGSFQDNLERGTGAGTGPRINTLSDAIKAIHDAYGGDVEIELNGVGFSRGSVAMKALLNSVSDSFTDGSVHINRVVLFDPVASIGLPPFTDNLAGYDLDFPDGVDSNSHIAEFYAANEYRRTFSSENYEEGKVHREIFPGAHAQVGGGYANDILASGPLASAMDFLSQDDTLGFKELPVEDLINIRLYNAVIENPYLVQALITDSRIESENLHYPGSDSFPLEFQQDYEFDNKVPDRDINNQPSAPDTQQFLEKIATSSPSVYDIEAMGYRPVPLPENILELPANVEAVLSSFASNLSDLAYDPNDPVGIEEFLDVYLPIYSDLREQLGWLRGSAEGGMEDIRVLDVAADTLNDRLELLVENQKSEQVEQVELAEIQHAAALRGMELDVMNSVVSLRDAVDSGDGLAITQEGLGYLSSLDDLRDTVNEDGFLSDRAEAIIDGLEHGIALGQAIDEGDGWEIAGSSVDLLLDIDHYAESTNSDFIGDTGSAFLNTASSAFDLTKALNEGNGWEIASSTTSLLSDIDTIHDIDGGSGALTGAASAAGLAVNIASLDDVLESGDGLQIAYTTASTVNNAINTYNIAANTVGYSNISTFGVSEIPVLGYVAAAVELMEGETTGAAVTAASAYLTTCGPYGWAAAAVLQVADLLGVFGDDDPPSATAAFSLDMNGDIIMDVYGDGEMTGAAEAYSSPLLDTIQGYREAGGRVEINGNLPSLQFEAGSDPKICYSSEHGGRVTIAVGDPSRLSLEMRGALYARDRGQHLDEAIHLASDEQGNIDFDQVDIHLASMGFIKHGITYTHGEANAPRIGQTYGNGIFHGGGNADGPEGEHFVARDKDITSLPLQDDQLPGRKIGQILRAVSLQQNFAGTGGLLMAMGMGLDADRATAAAQPAERVLREVTNSEYFKPLDAVQLAQYQDATPNAEDLRQTSQDMEKYSKVSQGTGGYLYQAYIDAQWPGVSDAATLSTPIGDITALRLPDTADPGSYLTGTTPLPQLNAYQQNSRNIKHPPKAIPQQEAEAQVSITTQTTDQLPTAAEFPTPEKSWSVAPPTNVRIPEEQLPENFAALPLPPDVEQGSVFTMDQDSSLRFLPSALTEELRNTPHFSASEESFTLVDLGTSEHGQVHLDNNGDIRFVAEKGFVGTASFEYDLRGPTGEITTHRALVVVNDVNNAPLLKDDHFTLNEGEVFYMDHLLDNDSDLDGDTLTFHHFRDLDHGELSFIDNRLAFTPEAGFTGNLDFSYWAVDRAGAYPLMARANLTIIDLYPEVNATDDHFIILEDQQLVITGNRLLTNDDLVNDGFIHLNGVQNAEHGQVSMEQDGTITFIPNPDYAGTEAGFSYTVEDDSGNTGVARVNIEVLDLRDSPQESDTTYNGAKEDETIIFTPDEIARFVTDPDGDLLHLDFITNVEGGRVEMENGIYTFIPDPDYSGAASFDYQANDGHQGTLLGHLEFEISPVNDPIEIGKDFLTTNEESRTVFHLNTLIANDFDPEGTPVEFVALGSATYGTVVLDGDGFITFTPETDYFGGDAGFSYIVRDGEGAESTSFVSVQVENVNDLPDIISVDLSTPEDQAIFFDAVTMHDFLRDRDGDTLQLVSMDNANCGTVREDGGTYTFIPDLDYHGPASLEYSVNDGNGGTVSGHLNIEILSRNDPTDFGEDGLETLEEKPVTTTVADLMANDTDADGELHFVSLGEASHGKVTMDNNGTITFTPEMDYFGNDAKFSYIVRDTENKQSTGLVTVQVENVNDLPNTISDTLITNEDQAIVFDASTVREFLSDADGDTLELTSMDNVNGGGVLMEDGDIYTFRPSTDYHGSATLNYSVNDGNGGTVTGILDIEILSRDDQTNFGEDRLETLEEKPVTTTVADLMANDTDADGDLRFVSLGEASHGKVTMDNNGIITFTPEMNYFGTDAGFIYVVEDADGYQADGTVVIEVENINDRPAIHFDRLHILEDSEFTFSSETIADFVHDPDADTLNFTSISVAQGGSFHTENGVYVFTPERNFYGETTFDYTVTDGNGEERPGRMHIDVTPVNDLPAVPGLSATMREDGEITFSVTSLMAGAVDVEDGEELRFSGITDSSNGDAWLDNDGLVHFLPDTDFFGTASFSYGVTDSEAGQGSGTVTIEVAGVNDTPLAVDDKRILAWGNNSYDNVYSPAVLLANDYDADGDALNIVSVSRSEYGTVDLDANGNINYRAPSDDWVGVDYFTYTIDDGNGGIADAVARVDVKLNTSPDAYSEVLFSREDIIADISPGQLLENDADVDGDTLFISAVGNAEHGAVSLLSNGEIRFIPDLNYNNNYPGQASFEYTISDGISDSVIAVALLDLKPVNDTPVLRGEILAGAIEDNSFSFTPTQLLANDIDVEAASSFETDTMAITDIIGADNGTLIYHGGSGTIVYTPNANYHGVDSFRYRVTDSHGATSEVESQISVRSVNDNPVVQEDRASAAEDSIWNRYSISGLLANDSDVDGDSLSLVNPHVIRGAADVRIRNGYLEVRPAFREDRVDVQYNVIDGHGGATANRLIIDRISEHNYAPTFTGFYQVEWESGWETWFTFQAEDRNGGNTWSVDRGDIATITPSHVNGGNIQFSSTNNANYSFKFEGSFPHGSLILTATDYSGATGSIYVEISQLNGTSGRYVYSPVVLDLDGDGVELLTIDEEIAFDWNRDGVAESTGWAGPDDGFLVYDHDHNMLVTRANELMLREYLPDATTDLEGLRAFDTNQDGTFNSEDTSWNDFGVWQDKNSNGITDEGEFQHLTEMEIVEIELESNGNEREVAGNTVFGSTQYHREDGSTGEVGDVALSGEEISFAQEGPTESRAEIEPLVPDQDVTVDAPSAELDEAESLLATAEEGLIAQLESEPPNDSNAEVAMEDPFQTEGEELTASGPESELSLDDAEINRVAQQLQSDAAAGSSGTDLGLAVSPDLYQPDATVDDRDLHQPDDTQEELLAPA